jgi:hypothetical protein
MFYEIPLVFFLDQVIMYIIITYDIKIKSSIYSKIYFFNYSFKLDNSNISNFDN